MRPAVRLAGAAELGSPSGSGRGTIWLDGGPALAVLFRRGRLGISDVIADEGLDTAQRAEAEQQIGCTTGTLTAAEYRTLLLANGFASIRVTATQDTEPGLRSAIIQAGDGHLCTSRAIADL
jgi:hypothetical protein